MGEYGERGRRRGSVGAAAWRVRALWSRRGRVRVAWARARAEQAGARPSVGARTRGAGQGRPWCALRRARSGASPGAASAEREGAERDRAARCATGAGSKAACPGKEACPAGARSGEQGGKGGWRGRAVPSRRRGRGERERRGRRGQARRVGERREEGRGKGKEKKRERKWEKEKKRKRRGEKREKKREGEICGDPAGGDSDAGRARAAVAATAAARRDARVEGKTGFWIQVSGLWGNRKIWRKKGSSRKAGVRVLRRDRAQRLGTNLAHDLI